MKTMRTHAGTRVTASVAGVVVAGATLVAGATGATAADTTAQLSSGTCETTADEMRHQDPPPRWTSPRSRAATTPSGRAAWTSGRTAPGRQNKVAGYRAVDFPLSAVGAASIDYTNHTPSRSLRPRRAASPSTRRERRPAGYLVGEADLRRQLVARRTSPDKSTPGAAAPVPSAAAARLNGIRRPSVEALATSTSWPSASRWAGAVGSGTINALIARLRHVHLQARGRPDQRGRRGRRRPRCHEHRAQGLGLRQRQRHAGHYDFRTTGGVTGLDRGVPRGRVGEQSAIAAVRDAEFPLSRSASSPWTTPTTPRRRSPRPRGLRHRRLRQRRCQRRRVARTKSPQRRSGGPTAPSATP